MFYSTRNNKDCFSSRIHFAYLAFVYCVSSAECCLSKILFTSVGGEPERPRMDRTIGKLINLACLLFPSHRRVCLVHEDELYCSFYIGPPSQGMAFQYT